MTLRNLYRIGVVFSCAAIFLAFGCEDWGSPRGGIERDIPRTLSSLRRVGDTPLYVMRYYGDYGFSEFLKMGGAAPRNRLVSATSGVDPWGCTCFAAMNVDSTRLFGRNFDWHECVHLLLFTDPPDGYASVSMVDLRYLGFDFEHLPDATGYQEELLSAPFLPFDGLNECGVAIGIMAVPHAQSPQNPARITIGELHAVRLVLDYAANVRDAITLMRSYNIRMEDPPLHYLIADRSGNSAVVEFVDGKMVVIWNANSWQVSTNFILSTSEAPDASPCWRYNTVHGALSAQGGITTPEGAMDLLERSSQANTRWSTVYDLSSGNIVVAVGRNYTRVHTFALAAE